MAFLILFSYPLGYFGFTIVPSFAYSYSSFEDVLSFFDNKLTRSILGLIGNSSRSSSGSFWTFDECVPEENNIIKSLAYKDARYIVKYPFKIDREDPLMVPVSQIWKKVTGYTFIDTKAQFFFCFDEFGYFLRLLIYFDGTLYFTDDSIYTRLDNSIYSRYQDSAIIRFTDFDNEVVDICIINCVNKGCFIDFISKY